MKLSEFSLKIFLILFFLLFFFIPSAFGKRLIIVTDLWPPYVMGTEKEPSGLDYEVMTAVLNRLSLDFEYRIVPWKRCIVMLKTKQADAILDVSKTDKRERFLIYPEEPLSGSHSVLFFKKGNSLTYKNLNSLSGKTIGTLRGYAYSKEFRTAANFIRSPVNTAESNFLKLINNRIDYFLCNKIVGNYTAAGMGIEDQVRFAEKPVSGGYNYLGFSKKPEHEKLAVIFGQELKKFKQTAEFKAIQKKYN